jgi:hypothetical protein
MGFCPGCPVAECCRIGRGGFGVEKELKSSFGPEGGAPKCPSRLGGLEIAASEKDSTRISPFVQPNVHVITCSSFMWPEMHASTEEFTWFLYVRTHLVIASHNLFPRGQKDALTTLLIHAG